MPKADMVDLSSSDIEEALELLSLSPARGYHTPLLNLQSSSDSDFFEDWPKANDMITNVYVALTTDASSSRPSTIDSLRGGRKACAGSSSARQSHLQATSLKKPPRPKTALTSASWRKSKKTKVDAERTLVTPTPHGGSLSAADFDKSEWEIMYPLFGEKGLIDPSEHVNRRDD
jgi:hypothetical protein